MRRLSCLSVFLISLSIFIVLSPKTVYASDTPTKEDYELFYNSVNANGINVVDVPQLAGKTFVVDIEALPTIGGFRYNDASISIGFYYDGVFNINSAKFIYGSGDNLNDEIFTSASISKANQLEFTFADDFDGSGCFYIRLYGDNDPNVIKLSLEEQTQYIALSSSEVENTDIPVDDTTNDIVVPNVTIPEYDAGDGTISGLLDGILAMIISFLKDLCKYAKWIIVAAVGLGVIFIGGKWLWRKTRNWLNRV